MILSLAAELMAYFRDDVPAFWMETLLRVVLRVAVSLQAYYNTMHSYRGRYHTSHFLDKPNHLIRGITIDKVPYFSTLTRFCTMEIQA